LGSSKKGRSMDFQALLRFAVDHDASDVHIQAGLPPHLRMGGILKSINQPPLTDEEVRGFLGSIVPARLRENFDDRLVAGLDFSHAAPGMGRFGCSATPAWRCASSRPGSPRSPNSTCPASLATSPTPSAG